MFAGYHYDLNLLTIHGKSRFPGLHVWLRDGRKARSRLEFGYAPAKPETHARVHFRSRRPPMAGNVQQERTPAVGRKIPCFT